MKKSLQALMRGVIDYAGLFPPAKLPMDAAIQNYVDYQKGNDAWMLSRFIIPASRLQELHGYADEVFVGEKPFVLSILGGQSETADKFAEEIQNLVQCCGQFLKEHARSVTADVLEIKLPKEAVLSNDGQMLGDLLTNAAQLIGTSDGLWLPQYVFYESLLSESWQKDIPVVMDAIAAHNKALPGNSKSYQHAGFKLRCGGVKASMFPSPEQISYVLTKAREYNVAVKCTAGLHHPIRHYNESVQTKMHGFINVFGGGMLAYMHDLNREELEEVIREEDPEQFIFKDDELSWHDYSISLPEINELRETALVSFGSCSFDEPREDLGKLKLL